jgi:hypothetical protein
MISLCCEIAGRDSRNEVIKELMQKSGLDDPTRNAFSNAQKRVTFSRETNDFRSITGSPFIATRIQNPSRLRSFDFTRSTENGKGILEIRLFEFPTSVDAQSAVMATILALMEKISLTFAASLGGDIRSLSGLNALLTKHANQSLEIRVANTLVRRRLPGTLLRLRAADGSDLIRKAIHEVEACELDCESTRLRIADDPNAKAKIGMNSRPWEGNDLVGTLSQGNDLVGTLSRREAELESKLDQLVVNVRKEPKVVLKALRDYLKAHNYNQSQTLFELFQNADDALSQLPMRDTDLNALVRVVLKDRKLVFEHHGRLINRSGGENSQSSKERDSGERSRDLVNMLEIGVSAKQESSTGRFGLGFKSVYLLTDQPEVRSGSLGFRVVGGLLPEQLEPIETNVIGKTTFTLPLRDEVSKEDAEACFSAFAHLAELLVLFAQRATHISGSGPLRFEAELEDLPTLIDGPERFNVGMLVSQVKSDSRWLFVRPVDRTTGPRLQLVFAIDGGDFLKPDASVPRVWVTVPTQEAAPDLGFVIGGPFAVDVGRCRLALEHSSTKEALERLSVLLMGAVISIFSDQAESFDWPEGVDIQSLRRSLFLVVTSNLRLAHGEGQLSWHEKFVRDALNDKRLWNVPMIPDQDGNMHPRSTLRRLHPLLESLGEECEFRNWLETDAARLDETVYTRLDLLSSFVAGKKVEVEVEALRATLDQTLRRSPDARVHAKPLCALLDRLRYCEPSVRDEVLSVVETLMIPTKVGDCSLADCVVRWHGLKLGEKSAAASEEIISRFAPLSLVFEPFKEDDRDDGLVALLRSYRDLVPKHFEDAQLSEWILKGGLNTPHEAHVAFAELLIYRQILNTISRSVRDQGRAFDWLTKSLFNEARLCLEERGFADIHFEVGAAAVAAGKAQPSFTPLATQPNLALELPHYEHPLRILRDWWNEPLNQMKAEAWYFDEVYGKSRFSAETLPDALKSATDAGGEFRHREAWMLMFLTAMAFKLGRVSETQNGTFVSRSEFLPVGADRNSTNDDWMGVLDDTFKGTEERYYHWLQLFPGFRAAWHFSNKGCLDLLANTPDHGRPREILVGASGTGLPGSFPMHTVLGRIGSAWLCRELVRLGVWDFKEGTQHFYVPWKNHTLRLLGLEKKARPEAVTAAIGVCLEGERYPFGPAFDLPLQLWKMGYSELPSGLPVLTSES